MSIECLRTADERFQNLPDFDFQPRYLDGAGRFVGMRQHYLDEGPADAEVTFLWLHGEPTWAYLYRKMIPVFTAAGHRVVVPDFFGFGRSDKPVDDSVYTFDFHRESLLSFVQQLSLSNVCLVCQDWGGLLGLTMPMEFSQSEFSRLLVMNTGIGTGKSPGKGFDDWKAFAAANPDLPVGQLLQRSHRGMTDAEAAAYDAPFPDVRYKGGVRRFPQLVPVSPDMEGVELGKRAANWWRNEWQERALWPLVCRIRFWARHKCVLCSKLFVIALSQWKSQKLVISFRSAVQKSRKRRWHTSILPFASYGYLSRKTEHLHLCGRE